MTLVRPSTLFSRRPLPRALRFLSSTADAPSFEAAAIQLHLSRSNHLSYIRDALLAPDNLHYRPPPDRPKQPPRQPPRRWLRPSFVKSVADKAGTYGLPPHQVELLVRHLDRCVEHSDYIRLISSLLAQDHILRVLRLESVQLVCDDLYGRSEEHLYEMKASGSLKPCSYEKEAEALLIATNQIRLMLEAAAFALPQSLVDLGVLSSARCRSFPSLKRYLQKQQETGARMSKLVFDKVMAAMDGRTLDRTLHPSSSDLRIWNDGHTLMALLGSPDTPEDAGYALSAHVQREHWSSLESWLHVLAQEACLPQLRTEWALWLDNRMRTIPVTCPSSSAESNFHIAMKKDPQVIGRLQHRGLWNTKSRGDLCFFDAFHRAGGVEEAWMVLNKSVIPFHILKPDTKAAMLKHPEFAAPELWTDRMRRALLQSYAKELSEIEEFYGIQWVWDEETGAGYHRILEKSFLVDHGDLHESQRP